MHRKSKQLKSKIPKIILYSPMCIMMSEKQKNMLLRRFVARVSEFLFLVKVQNYRGTTKVGWYPVPLRASLLEAVRAVPGAKKYTEHTPDQTGRLPGNAGLNEKRRKNTH
jgi:hypothetical protein